VKKMLSLEPWKGSEKEIRGRCWDRMDAEFISGAAFRSKGRMT